MPRQPEPIEKIGEVIRSARTEKGLTQEYVAYRAKIEQSLLSKIERGAARPGPAIARRIAMALGLPEDSLVRS